MSLAELNRAIESKIRVRKIEQRDKANFDYKLGDLIGRSIARLYSSSASYPEIHTVYPQLFDGEEIEEQRKAQRAELSALRFKQFAASYNKQFKEVAKVNE